MLEMRTLALLCALFALALATTWLDVPIPDNRRCDKASPALLWLCPQ
jgi:hypothetical protein